MTNTISYTEHPEEGGVWDVIIIGSGPAALTAAIYTTRGAASTLILAGDTWGGQLMLTTTVDNFPGFPDGIMGPDLMQKMKDQALRFGSKIIDKKAQSIDNEGNEFVVKTQSEEYKSKVVIIATGADTKWLGVEGEEKLRGKGVSSCAPCDAPFFKDKSAAVVGGGDSAMEEALVLTKYATKVVVIHRRNEFKASVAMQKRVLENEKITVFWDSEVEKMEGETKLESILIKTRVDSEFWKEFEANSLTSFGGEKVEEKDGLIFWKYPVDGVFVAIGHIPSTDIFKGVVEMDDHAYIKRNEEVSEYNLKSKTNVEGIFVAGDVHDRDYKQAVTAAGYGCQAGMDALKYLDKEVPTW